MKILGVQDGILLYHICIIAGFQCPNVFCEYGVKFFTVNTKCETIALFLGEILFNATTPELAPDFIFDDPDFFPDPDKLEVCYTYR